MQYLHIQNLHLIFDRRYIQRALVLVYFCNPWFEAYCADCPVQSVLSGNLLVRCAVHCVDQTLHPTCVAGLSDLPVSPSASSTERYRAVNTKIHGRPV